MFANLEEYVSTLAFCLNIIVCGLVGGNILILLIKTYNSAITALHAALTVLNC